MTTLGAVLLAAASAFDGGAALRHASALSALGPHPWGSPRSRAAAQYVSAQMRAAGLAEVRIEEFESHGVIGVNAVGVLRAPGPEYLVIGAHHDTAPEAPGAYDDGGGVGVMLEAARVLAARRQHPRTLVFVSFDGEEAWSSGKTTTAGSRAYIKSLGPDARDLVAAFAIEMCGWKRGTPVVHPIAYADPIGGGRPVIAPAWVVRAALEGARRGRAPLRVGDPWLSWLYQPAVRSFRVGLYGDDLSFLQAGLPALFAADSSFALFYPWYHRPEDTADKLDAASLARMGGSVLGAIDALSRVRRGPASEPDWYAAFGAVAGRPLLLLIGAATLLPLALRLGSGGWLSRASCAAQALGFGVLLWRNPVPALWVLALPNLASGFKLSAGPRALALVPALALAGLGLAAWLRGFVRGTWLAPWELGLAGVALLIAAVPARAKRSPPGRGRPGPRRR